ncbi:ribosome biogenesis GTP-binding protein YihA/YsxC [Athalassotoga saccharophila]|uniref:ribosome biogenesis GTP-binding protein YihA/YsxC n=1 Tax=Athalassotoga saccharophila TaxID=1441386 RepID=UPI001379FEFA|nr:ribosome biogenesis GTP-binding protein YihA/YsxC [Athalassotoga saccharophila]BBJ27245.1 putative GTP-binding protein EngB [Athalassotoga saccharophila]
MFVEKVELSVDAHQPSDFPEFLSGEVIFVGRSNVGKSSMLNVIFGKKLARTSSIPGKTKSLIFFKVNDEYYFVDFPGYGYAKTSKAEREKFQLLVNAYFKMRRPSGIFMLIDSMIPNQRSDIEAFEFFKNFSDTFLVLTKIDRLSKSKINEKISEVEGTFKEAKSVILFSSVNRAGLLETEKILREILKTR